MPTLNFWDMVDSCASVRAAAPNDRTATGHRRRDGRRRRDRKSAWQDWGATRRLRRPAPVSEMMRALPCPEPIKPRSKASNRQGLRMHRHIRPPSAHLKRHLSPTATRPHLPRRNSRRDNRESLPYGWERTITAPPRVHIYLGEKLLFLAWRKPRPSGVNNFCGNRSPLLGITRKEDIIQVFRCA